MRLSVLLCLGLAGGGLFQKVHDAALRRVDQKLALRADLAVELEGVCGPGARGTECWDARGRRSYELLGWRKSLPGVDWKREPERSRVVVLRRTENPIRLFSGDPRYLHIPEGDLPGGRVALVVPPTFLGQGPSTAREAYSLRFAGSGPFGQIRVEDRRRLRSVGRLSLRKGGRCTFGGATLSVASLERDNQFKRGAWTYRTKCWKAVIKVASRSPALVYDGVTSDVKFLDAKGRLIDRALAERLYRAQPGTGQPNAVVRTWREIQISTVPRTAGLMDLYLNVNPVKLRTVTIVGATVRRYDLTGIPLQPR